MRNVKIKSYDRQKPSGEACLGFIAMPEHIKTTFTRAKKICKQMGGSLPYFDTLTSDNSEDYFHFHETQSAAGRVDWLGIRKHGSRDIFKTIAPAKSRKKVDIFYWLEGQPGVEGKCVAIGPGDHGNSYETGWFVAKCEEKLQVTCMFKHPFFCYRDMYERARPT